MVAFSTVETGRCGSRHSSGRWLLFPQWKQGDAGASFFTVIGSGYLSALEFISMASKALAFCTAWANVSFSEKIIFVVLRSSDLLRTCHGVLGREIRREIRRTHS